MFYKFTLLVVGCLLLQFGFKTTNFSQSRNRDIPGHTLEIYPQFILELPIYSFSSFLTPHL